MSLQNAEAMKSGRSILSCPAEIIDAIILPLARKELQSLRRACRVLQDHSFDHFQKAHFTRKVVYINPEGLQNLLDIARNKHFNENVQNLVIRFHGQAMRATCRLALPTFSRRVFADKDEHAQLLDLHKTRLFETPYFQNANKNHSPGDLFGSPKEYRVGEVITANMADRINQWNDLIKNHSWIPMLEEAIQNLPNLHTVMIHDERDPKAGPFYGRKDIGPFQHPHCILSKILAENAIAIQNYCLDFELGSAAEWYRAQKSLQALSLANPVTLRKLSVCMDVFTEHWTNPGHYSDSFSPVFPAVEELHLYHRNLSTTPVVVLNKFKRIIEADGIPGLKVLRLENVRMPHLDATQVCFLRSCETIILNEIAFSTVVDLRGCLQLLSDSASVKHIWLDHLYAFTPWVPFFKNRESVEEGQFHSNSRHPFDFSGVEDEIKRRTMRAGKILRWGKPPSRVSSTWEGGVSKDFIQDHSCLLFGSSRPVEM